MPTKRTPSPTLTPWAGTAEAGPSHPPSEEDDENTTLLLAGGSMASPPAQASAQAPGTTSTLASTSTPASAPASPPRPPAGGNVREHAHVECGPARITVRRPSRCCSVEAIRLLPVVGTASTTTADGDAGPHQHQHHLPEIQEGSTLRLMSITEMGTTDSTNGNGNESGHGGEYDSGLATEGTVGGSGIGIGSGGLSPPIVMGTKLRARASTTVGTPGEPLGRPRAHTVGVRFPSRNNVTRFTESAAQGHRRGRSNTVRSSRSGRSGSPEPRSSLSLDITVPEARDTAIADHHGSLHDDVVGMLDVVDPEIGTVNHLQNVTNGIMFPNIPSLWSRRPHLTLNATTDEYYVVPQLVDEPDEVEVAPPINRTATFTRYIPGFKKHPQPQRRNSAPAEIPLAEIDSLDKKLTVDVEEVAGEHELDQHVRRVLERKQKARRALRGLWAYLKTPMGMFTAVYGFCVAFWGAAIVLFLLGWIPTSSKDTQDKWVEISSQVTNGLFTITGVGLIPWRAIDTYRMGVIWTMRMRIKRRRAAQGLPPAKDADDLPSQEQDELLSEKECEKLKHEQEKFAESQTWYRPHETATHFAFPIKWALWNTILMDGNSFFQCILCGCMWGMNRHKRPAWTTGTLIPLSFLCGIGAAVLIWQGGVRTKKKKLVEDKLRQALGVDEDVPETVKRPRRATVAGASPLTERPSPLPPVPPVGTVSNRFGKDVKDVLVLESVDEEEDKEKEDIAVLVRRGST